MEQRERLAELDGYRGLAALAIVVYHVYQDPRLGLGRFYPDDRWLFVHVIGALNVAVSWFFVLSGFLLFLPFARAALAGTLAPSWRAFLRRRAWRILPLYLTVFVVVWTLTPGHDWRDLATHLTFTHIFSPAYYFRTVGAAWSLADEAIYYLMLALVGPLACWLCRPLTSRRLRLGVLAGLLALVMAATIDYAHAPIGTVAAHGPVAQFGAFGMGMLLALVAAYHPHPLTVHAGHWLRWCAMLLVALPFVAPLFADLLGRLPGLGITLLLASTVLVRDNPPWQRMLACRPLAALGAWSYGLYLWHQPIEQALVRHGWLMQGTRASYLPDLALLLALALPLAALTYYAIERPALRRAHQPHASRLAAQTAGSGSARRAIAPETSPPSARSWGC